MKLSPGKELKGKCCLHGDPHPQIVFYDKESKALSRSGGRGFVVYSRTAAWSGVRVNSPPPFPVRIQYPADDKEAGRAAQRPGEFFSKGPGHGGVPEHDEKETDDGEDQFGRGFSCFHGFVVAGVLILSESKSIVKWR